MNWVSPSVRSPTTGSRVVWALGLTMARWAPTSALRREDLPALGAPARAMWPVRVGMGEDVADGPPGRERDDERSDLA